MINPTRKKMTKTETILVITVCILLSIAGIFLAFFRRPGETVEITVDGHHYRTVDLGQVISEYDIQIDAAYPVTLHVTREGITFVHSQCPDKLCEGFGCVPRDSNSAVCLPAKVVVRSTQETFVVGRGAE